MKLTPKKLLSLFTALAAIFSSSASSQTTDLVSLTPTGVASTGAVRSIAASENGRFVTYVTTATDLAHNDTNGYSDVYLFDTALKQITPISHIAPNGALANGQATQVNISRNGRFILFESHANNIVPGDTNGRRDVFLFDRELGTLARASVDAIGTQANQRCFLGSVTDSGRYVTFSTESTSFGNSNNMFQVYRKDMVTGVLLPISVNSLGQFSNAVSNLGSMSADGDLISFTSRGDNLTPSIDSHGFHQVYLRKVSTGELEMISTELDGTGAELGGHYGLLSDNGERIAFMAYSDAMHPDDTSSFASVYSRELATGVLSLVSRDEFGTSLSQDLTLMDSDASGQHILLSTTESLSSFDGNSHHDLYRFSVDTQSPPTLTSITQSGHAHPTASVPFGRVVANGNMVIFYSQVNYTPNASSSNLSQLYAFKTNRGEMGTYGNGKAGSLGVPSLAFEHCPVVSHLPQVVVENTSSLNNPICILVYGIQSDNSIVSWGNRLATPDRAARFILTPGTNQLPLGFTADMVPLGFTVYYQALIQDPGAAGGISHTNGAWLRTGY